MKTRIFLSFVLPAVFLATTAFCGFYVAKADAKLFNKTSQVIIVRSEGQTVITMASDFQGEVKDFAMVVPVPVVLKEDQIRVAEATLFDKLDTYSGPRLVEYHDDNPCERWEMVEDMAFSSAPSDDEYGAGGFDDDMGVTIEARYTVGEYDILILSAAESNGLEKWLIQNGYKIPSGAAEILQPYIRNGMKFFVAKVNLEEFAKSEAANLRPLQMTFRSEKFGLPIRLGMANAEADQDMVVYAFSDKGRIETTNYRTVEIPTDRDIPLFVQERFGEFYVSLWDKAWSKAGKDAVLLEYSWDLSGDNFTKCDPCATTPPSYAELREAGVFWVEETEPKGWGSAEYAGDLHFTRLHLRYNRKTFPQDLEFQVTPNKASFQGRYVMHHPASGDLSCSEGQDYLKKLVSRRKQELENLHDLTGWDTSGHEDYVNEYADLIESKGWLEKIFGDDEDKNFFWIGILFTGGLGGILLLLGIGYRRSLSFALR